MLPVPPDPDVVAQEAAAPASKVSGAEYLLLEASSREALEAAVNAHLRHGWQVQGGVAVATHGPLHWWYYQAMVAR